MTYTAMKMNEERESYERVLKGKRADHGENVNSDLN